MTLMTDQFYSPAFASSSLFQLIQSADDGAKGKRNKSGADVENRRMNCSPFRPQSATLSLRARKYVRLKNQ